MIVVKVVDQDIADKVDTEYISEHFNDLQNVGIVYICTREGGEEDDWIDEDGMRNVVIHLPYLLVKRMVDVKPLMLAKARERLGLVALN